MLTVKEDDLQCKRYTIILKAFVLRWVFTFAGTAEGQTSLPMAARNPEK